MRQQISKVLLSLISLAILNEIDGYSKYGRTCKDIGCLNNEVCVMQEDRCDGRSNECGRYPTCQRASQLSCSNIECPPGQECSPENGSAKCVNSRPSASIVPQSNVPNAPAPYPADGTTSRPRPAFAMNTGDTGYVGGQPGSGYPGGQVGSGYPGGQSRSGYPGGQAGSGYPGQQPAGVPGYPGNGYPAPAGYPAAPQQRPIGSGYPGGHAGAGYPSNGYSGSGYPNNGGYAGYPSQGNNYGGYPGYSAGYPAQYPSNANNQYAQPYPQTPTNQKSSTPSLTDQLTSSLKIFAGVLFVLCVQRFVV